MPGRCSCAGSTCGCALRSGNATTVRGTGNAGDPYYVDVDPTALNIGAVIRTSDSTTIKFSKTGTGGSNDPVIISGDVRLLSPDGSTWRPSISNGGIVTWAKA